jgi:hypothetical protein
MRLAFFVLLTCVAVGAPAQGRDVGKDQGRSEEVIDWQVRQLEQEIAANLSVAVRGEDEPLIKDQRRRLRELRRQWRRK